MCTSTAPSIRTADNWSLRALWVMTSLKTLQEITFVTLVQISTIWDWWWEGLVFMLKELIKVSSSSLTANIQSWKQIRVGLGCLQLQILGALCFLLLISEKCYSDWVCQSFNLCSNLSRRDSKCCALPTSSACTTVSTTSVLSHFL